MSSPTQTLRNATRSSSGNFPQKFPAQRPISASEPSAPGNFDDASVIRETLVRCIKQSNLSRQVIAERMSYLLGRTVTEKMLFAFTAESQNDRRWPAEFDRAFCEATGDLSLIRDRALRAGLIVISEEEQRLLEFGRAHLTQKRAAAEADRIERELTGGAQ